MHLRDSLSTSSGLQLPVMSLVALRHGLPNWQKCVSTVFTFGCMSKLLNEGNTHSIDVCGFSITNGMPRAKASRARRALNRARALPMRIRSASLSLTHLKPHGNKLLRRGGGRPRRAREKDVQGVAIMRALIFPFLRALIKAR